MDRKKINPDLKKGDRVILLSMQDDHAVSPLTKGVVTRMSKDPFEDSGYIIEVSWENGRTLSLLSAIDKWMLVDDFEQLNKKRISEATFDHFENQLAGAEYAKYYKIPKLLQFLVKLKDSGITNMFGASPYLYMGKDRIKHKHFYDSTSEDNESYDELLEMADEIQSIMIKGSIKKLETEGKEPDLNNINRTLKKDAEQIFMTWVSTL